MQSIAHSAERKAQEKAAKSLESSESSETLEQGLAYGNDGDVGFLSGVLRWWKFWWRSAERAVHSAERKAQGKTAKSLGPPGILEQGGGWGYRMVRVVG